MIFKTTDFTNDDQILQKYEEIKFILQIVLELLK